MKRLFTSDKREDWTDDAREYDRKVTQALRHIIKEAVLKGDSLIDLNYIINASVTDMIVSQRFDLDLTTHYSCDTVGMSVETKTKNKT